MSLTKSLTDLVNGMKGGETTQNWDVVVSYSVNQLNTLLQSIWASNQASQTLSVTSPYLDLMTNTSHTLEWQIQLTSQTLSFTNDGQARLGMTISGKHHVQGTDAGGHEFPWSNVPDGCTFVAHVPLQSVRAKEGDAQGTDAAPGHQTITFGDDPDTKLHIVFNFDNDTTSKYTIDCPVQYQLAFEPLADQLQKWMQDNFSTIQYSLAVIAPTETVGAIYLTPLAMGFTVFTDGDNACLSVYIQTKDSGNNPGNANRVFNLPNNGSANALPVPSGHSASIIIRRKLFHDLFLLNPLKTVKTSNQLAFKSVTSVAATNGFAFDLRLDNHIVNDFSHTNWAGFGLEVIKRGDWDLSANPLSLKIDGGNVSFSYSGAYMLEWMDVGPSPHLPWGDVHWNPSISKCGSMMTTSQGQITARVEINPGDWTTSRWAEDSDASIDKRKWTPDSVANGLDSIPLPTFSQSMRLDYFATTNVFAPGKHVIDIDTSAGVFTPYDVLLVGNVAASA